MNRTQAQSEKPKISLSRRKKIVFSLILVMFILLCVDSALFVFLQKLRDGHNIFHDQIAINDRVIDEFYETYFHPTLGWDIPKVEQGSTGQRRSPNYQEREWYEIKTFGDSFVYGFQLSEQETFQYFVEAQTGWQCLNYGVNGFGTDQALLKYHSNPVKSKYTILGVLDENIARVVTTWWSFYSFRDVNNIIGTKPKFLLQDQSYVLQPNPIQDYNGLKKLQNPAFVKTLAERDYWPQYHVAINAPPLLKWPAMATLLPHLNFFVRNVSMMMQNRFAPTYESKTGRRRFYHLYENDSEALKTMQYVIGEFVRTAQSREEIPIIMIFPIKDTMAIMKTFGKKPYQPIIDHLQQMNYTFIDFGDVFLQEDHRSYYFKNDFHLSAKGNQRVAEELIRYIRALEP